MCRFQIVGILRVGIVEVEARPAPKASEPSSASSSKKPCLEGALGSKSKAATLVKNEEEEEVVVVEEPYPSKKPAPPKYPPPNVLHGVEFLGRLDCRSNFKCVKSFTASNFTCLVLN